MLLGKHGTVPSAESAAISLPHLIFLFLRPPKLTTSPPPDPAPAAQVIISLHLDPDPYSICGSGLSIQHGEINFSFFHINISAIAAAESNIDKLKIRSNFPNQFKVTVA